MLRSTAPGAAKNVVAEAREGVVEILAEVRDLGVALDVVDVLNVSLGYLGPGELQKRSPASTPVTHPLSPNQIRDPQRRVAGATADGSAGLRRPAGGE